MRARRGIKRAFMAQLSLPTMIYVTCNTLDQRTCRGHRKAEIPGQSRLTGYVLLLVEQSQKCLVGIPEIPRRVRETENGNWSLLLK